MSSRTALNNSAAAVSKSKIVGLAGGVGGAKLAQGLYQALAPDSLTVIVNTADDFTYWGLHISPDLDTVMYTLAGMANESTGWGVADETWTALDAAGRLGGETWFRIGDKDLATHVLRTQALRTGKSLTGVTADFASRLGIRARLLPMTDAAVATSIETPDGWLAFQDYFVRRQHRDPVRAVRIDGIEQAEATGDAKQAIDSADVIVFCPSNPIVSIGPILALHGMQELLKNCNVPRIAVSPIVGGKALRGPADTMLSALGHESSALGVARLYQGLLSGIVIDELDAEDAPAIRKLGMEVLVTGTVMRTIPDRRSLAERILQWCARLR
jgi:LPPG:FO 2-phospho-L-lactate transferase